MLSQRDFAVSMPVGCVPHGAQRADVRICTVHGIPDLMNPKEVVFRNSIPKGLRIKAQGCEELATLGMRCLEINNPNGVEAAAASRSASMNRRNPVGVEDPKPSKVQLHRLH